MAETPGQRAAREKAEEVRDKLRTGVNQFGDRLREELEEMKPRMREGITSAMDGSRKRRPLGRPPTRRPPSGRPPSARDR
jgi:hypothetical protein